VIAADTNVLVRLFVRDDPSQAARAERLLATCLAEREECLVTLPVLCELEWVLESAYGARRDDVAAAVRALLTTAPFLVERADLVQRALHAYTTSRADLSDCLLGFAARETGARTTFTFDRALRRLDTFTLL
jgi:predicted nucleic-acid-binding protein